MHTDNNAWYRAIAAGWARRMISGNSPGAWANHTDNDVQFVMSQLGLRPGDRVLDLGCGWGRHSLPLASAGLRVTGLDISHDLLLLARYHAEQQGVAINWIEGDIADVPLRGSFDAVVQFYGNFMTWFSDPERTRDALWNVAGLLRSGGRLLFGTLTWQPVLPVREHDWDEWNDGAAIYRHRFDPQRRIAHTQTVLFGPAHARREFRRETWWPSQGEMEVLFGQMGLKMVACFNDFAGMPFTNAAPGLVYLLERD